MSLRILSSTALKYRGFTTEALDEKLLGKRSLAQMDVVYTEGIVSYAKSLNPHSLEPSERQYAISEMKKAIDEAYFLGAKIFQIIGGPDPGIANRVDAKRYFIDSICEVCEYASVGRFGRDMMILWRT